MNQSSSVPGNPREQVRAIQVFFFSIITGAVFFTIIAAVVRAGEEPGRLAAYADTFLYITGAVAAICLLVAIAGYKKSMAAAKDSLIPLQEKLKRCRLAFIRYIAFCEGAALLSIMIFFLDNDYRVFIVTGIAIIAMFLKLPTRRRIIDDLSLDWKDQQEFE